MYSILPSKLSNTLLLSSLCLGFAAPQSAHITDEEEELIIIIVPTVVGVFLIGIIITTLVLCKKRRKEKEVDMARDLEVETKVQNQKKESVRSPVGSPLASSRSSQLSPGRPWDPKLSLLSRSKSNTSVEFANQSSLHDEEDDAIATQNPISTLVPRQINEVRDRRVSSSLKGVRARAASQPDPYSSSEESEDTDTHDSNTERNVKAFPIIPVPSMAELPPMQTEGDSTNPSSSRSRSSSHSSKSSEKSRSRSSSKAETPLPSIALQAASELAVTPPNVTPDDEDLIKQRAENIKPSSPKSKKKKHRSKLESDAE